MKTICFVVHVFPSMSETFVVNQIIEAKKRGYSVRILTYKLGALEHSSQKNLILHYELLKNTIVIDYKIPKSTPRRLFKGLISIISNFKYWMHPADISKKHRLLTWPFFLRFYDNFRHVDVFHIQYAMMGTAIAEMQAIGFLKAKLVTTFHGHDAHFKNNNELRLLQSTYRLLFSVSDYLTVNTPYLEAILLALGCKKEKIKVIPMAIDIHYFKSSLNKKLPVNGQIKLISVGRLIEFKGHEYAIDAVKILVNKGLGVHYTIIGEGVLYKSLQAHIERLKLTNYVKLVGKRDQEEIREFLDSHHLYLMSSITDSNGRCETQGVVTAEAQAMGLPVIAFDSGGIPYTIKNGETGFLVPEKDVDAYAEAIVGLIEKQELYQQLSEHAKEFATLDFSNELMAERFIALYEA